MLPVHDRLQCSSFANGRAWVLEHRDLILADVAARREQLEQTVLPNVD